LKTIFNYATISLTKGVPQMKKTFVLSLLLLAACAVSGYSQADADREGIKRAALNYAEGWYAGDAARMERALHPELAKRIVETDARGRSRLGQQSAMTLVANTRRGGGTDIPADQRKSDVRILDVYGNAASVRVQAASWVDYMHVAKSNGRWVIVNVLWELEPSAAGASSCRATRCTHRWTRSTAWTPTPRSRSCATSTRMCAPPIRA
jgi:hypothetical protein